MKSNYKINHFKSLYIFFSILSLIIFFFSTTKVEAKAFDIDNIEISKPFEMNFNKNMVVDDGFRKAFSELIYLIVNSSDKKKIKNVKLNEIKAMVETFSIKEEKFIKENYYVKIGVSFNKKKVFNFLEKKNIFPTIPLEKKLLFIPIVIDENKKDLLVFGNNNLFKEWNKQTQSYHLIKYILPTEDLEDFNLLKKNYDNIEQYDFKEITSKYNLEDSIIALIFKNSDELRILSRISVNDNTVLKNLTFANIDINNSQNIKDIIEKLKNIYEDHWKNLNQINTSIKLPLKIKIKNLENKKILNFEKVLRNTDLIYDFFIIKFDKDFVYYQILFNGTPDNFLKNMTKNNFSFNTQNIIWTLK